MSFNEQLIERVKKQYTSMGDFGPGPLYIAIAELIVNGYEDLALAIATAAGDIHMQGDPFIVEGQTSNNEVFVEVFRRAAFPDDVEETMEYRASRTALVGFLSDFALRTEESLRVVGAANDDHP